MNVTFLLERLLAEAVGDTPDPHVVNGIEYFTTKQVSDMLGVGRNWASRKFGKHKGVIRAKLGKGRQTILIPVDVIKAQPEFHSATKTPQIRRKEIAKIQNVTDARYLQRRNTGKKGGTNRYVWVGSKILSFTERNWKASVKKTLSVGSTRLVGAKRLKAFPSDASPDRIHETDQWTMKDWEAEAARLGLIDKPATPSKGPTAKELLQQASNLIRNSEKPAKDKKRQAKLRKKRKKEQYEARKAAKAKVNSMFRDLGIDPTK